MDPVLIILIGLAAVLILIIISCIRIVPQAHAYVIERLGAYHQTWATGLHFKLPFVDKISKRFNYGKSRGL